MSSEPNFLKSDPYNLVENKLLLLYLIEKMEIPISINQISQFVLEEEMMNYFSLQQCLSEMVTSNLIDKTQTDNITSYTITDEGITTLEFFIRQIPVQSKSKINKYVAETVETIKQDYEVTSNFFYNHDSNEFIVKCGVYDNETTLLELNISVVTKEQAKLLCANWKKNVNKIYLDMLQLLISPDPYNPDSTNRKNISL